MANYYVFRINYGEHYKKIRKEILEGRLRQGWGAEGMSICNTVESYLQAWKDDWGYDAEEESYIRRKYRNLCLMHEMKQGDRIVVPKLSLDSEDGWTSFSILECKGDKYRFEVLGADFGHIISVHPLVSFSYGRDGESMQISKKFGSYRSAINRVYDVGFQNAVEVLLGRVNDDSEYAKRPDKSILSSLYSTTSRERKEYLQNVVKMINSWQPHKLEDLIGELFEKNGYVLLRRNHYDKEGGDIDLAFECFVDDSLMGKVFSLSSKANMPEIRVQAKNKKGSDTGDIEGVEQLLKMEGHDQAINIVINTTTEFSESAKEKAAEKGVVLINGLEFADLLVRYGIDIAE